MESIVYPSSSLARGFESYTGLIARETLSTIFLRTSRDAEVRIPRPSIEAIQPTPLSLMPAGLDKVMTTEQLRDLVAYLTVA